MKLLRTALLLSLVVVAILFAAAPIPIITVGPAQNYPNVTSGSDTQVFSAWSAAGGGGNFKGGHIYGTCLGDGGFIGETGTQGHTQICELVTYDPYNVGNTLVNVVNKMADYDATQSTCLGSTNANWGYSGMAIWMQGGNMYEAVSCIGRASPFGSFSTWIAISPNFGVDWCNYAHYIANSNTCTSGFWSATGDVPTANNSSNVQWPSAICTGCGAEALSFMGFLAAVEIIQDGASAPTLPGGLDNTYTYFTSNGEPTSTILNRAIYLHREKTDPMLPANWQHWDGSTWNATASAALNIIPSAWAAQECTGPFSVAFNAKTSTFWMTGYCANISQRPQFAYSTDLKNWTVIPDIGGQGGSVGYGFVTFMLATMQDWYYGGFTLDMSCNGQPGDAQTPVMNSMCFQRIRFSLPNVTGGFRSVQ